MSLNRSNLLILAIAVGVGMAFVFARLVIASPSYGVLIGLCVVGALFVLVGLTTRKVDAASRLSWYDYTTLKDSVLVNGESLGQIIFSPAHAVKEPKLFLTTQNKPILVEDVWLEGGCGTLRRGQPASRWRNGVAYKDTTVTTQKTLRVVVSNPGKEPVIVTARIIGRKESA
jgi:hypothetical protein